MYRQGTVSVALHRAGEWAASTLTSALAVLEYSTVIIRESAHH